MKDLSPLAVFLQSKQIDLSEALERIQAHAESVESKVTSKNSLMLFNVLMEESEQIFNGLAEEMTIMQARRLTFQQTKSYFNFYVNMVRGFTEGIKERIGKRELKSSLISKLSPSKIRVISNESISAITEIYHSAISKNERSSVQFELQKEIAKFKEYEAEKLKDMPMIKAILQMNDYPLLNQLYKIFVTITVTNSSAERSFSKLKLTKTDLRSTKSDKNLSNECIISINRDIGVDISSVVEKFTKESNLRIEI